MAYLLPHLNNGWQVDMAIKTEEERVVVIRFGRDQDPKCMLMDEILAAVSDVARNFAVVYVVDIQQVPEFNTMYELTDPCTVMFFYKNHHIKVDAGTGNNNKINFPVKSKQDFLDILETVYRGARKGKGLVITWFCKGAQQPDFIGQDKKTVIGKFKSKARIILDCYC